MYFMSKSKGSAGSMCTAPPPPSPFKQNQGERLVSLPSCVWGIGLYKDYTEARCLIFGQSRLLIKRKVHENIPVTEACENLE